MPTELFSEPASKYINKKYRKFLQGHGKNTELKSSVKVSRVVSAVRHLLTSGVQAIATGDRRKA